MSADGERGLVTKRRQLVVAAAAVLMILVGDSVVTYLARRALAAERVELGRLLREEIQLQGENLEQQTRAEAQRDRMEATLEALARDH